MKENNIPKHWQVKKFEDFLDYLQPTPYIVESTEYSDEFKTPVLTAGKSFVLGNTNETKGIFISIPVIIFDDFTTANKFVNFPFKVKSSAMKILKPKTDSINLKFVFYYMQTVRITIDTHKRYWISVFSKHPIPFPPFPEQQAIVSKIEELLSELENGKQQLQTAQQQLKVYRQSLLKWAFEGKLTNKNVKDGELPEGWKWASVGDICDMKAGFFVKADNIEKEYKEGLFPCYGGNGLRGYTNSFTHKGKYSLVGRQGALCGNVHRVNGVFHATEHAVVTSPKDGINTDWLFYKLTAMKLNQYSAGAAQPGLSVNKLLKIKVFYPPVSEQQLIVSELESKLTVCDKIEETISQSLQQAESLRQSILKKAFEGKLVNIQP